MKNKLHHGVFLQQFLSCSVNSVEKTHVAAASNSVLCQSKTKTTAS